MTVFCNIQYEMTDTFGGEANYSWVHRGEIEMEDTPFSDLAAVRKVKKELGLAGVRCKTTNYGDMIKLRPIGMCIVIFITFHSFGSTSENTKEIS